MPFNPSTDLGKLRAVIGDTSDLKELFSDDYLNALLSAYASNIGKAAIAALTRLKNDPDLCKQKFAGLGRFGIQEWSVVQRSIAELIREIKEGHMSVVATASGDVRFPEADIDIIGQSTDEDGWYEEGSIETLINDLDSKLT